jgi:large subunit ribosomal protein L13
MRNSQKTTLLTREAAEAQRGWWVVDLDGKVLGRAATKIASVLRGKHKPTYTPHVDDGDFVVVLNADKVVLTGGKWEKKQYWHYSGFRGGLRPTRADRMRDTYPDRIVREAVWGMLPKTRLSRKLMKKLKVYRGTNHDHHAQKPQTLAL